MNLRNRVRIIIEYNVFDTNSTDESVVRTQRWATRLYMLVLSLAMMVLLFYTVLNVSAVQIEIDKPSLSTYFDLYNEYYNINCPCTQISTLYKEFLQLSYTNNQICSSEFITTEWIEFLFNNNQTTSRYAADFRATASHQFQILRELCQLSNTAIEDGLQMLYNSQLISGQLLSEDLFEAELEADIQAFQRVTTTNFIRELTFLRSLIFGNQLLPAIETAFTIIVRSDTPGIIRSTPGINTNLFQQFNGSECGCTDFASCHMSAGFYDFDTFDTSQGIFNQNLLPPQEYFSEWYTGCWPSETLLLSNLQNFYNQTAVNKIITYINSSISSDFFLALNLSQNSSFNINSTIESLVEELFIEEWIQQLNYTAYFHQCQPDTCIFDVNKRASVLYIFTSLLGLYGGLSVVLIFVSPYVVKFIMKQIQRRSKKLFIEQPVPNHIYESRLDWIKQLWSLIVNLNIFKSSRKNTALDQKHQRWFTRLYILSLILAVLFLTFYTWLTTESRLITIKNPSLNTVKYLQEHVSSLQCPCTDLSISYEDLIYLEPTYHQICSSEFIGSTWIEGLNEIASLSAANLYSADFRFSGPIFQLLKSMCDLGNDTVINALFVFGQTQLVTDNLITTELFNEQLELAIDQFISTTPNTLLRILQLIRNFTYMNQFVSGSYANFNVNYSIVQQYAKSNITLGIYNTSIPLPNGTLMNCSCANDIQCGRPAALYKGPSGARNIIFIIPGFYSKCFPVESLLPSTLQCFYSNQPCLDLMGNILNESLFHNITRLNASQPSRFTINTTINDLLEQLFIESWSSSLFYSSYFNACKPIDCSYTIITQKGALQVVTTITGLFGGLSVVLRLLIPTIGLGLIKLARKCHPIQLTDITVQQNNNPDLHRTPILKKIYSYFLLLNMFETTHKKIVNEREIHLQRQATRVYFLLLSLALFILIIYTSLTYQQNNTKIQISSLKTFENLQNLYGSTTVQCPCTKISFNSATFYQIEPTFHEICSSDFVNQIWLNILFTNYKQQNVSDNIPFTYTGTAFTYFQTLQILCDLTKQATTDARDLFLSTQFVSAYMLDYDIFNEQTTAALNSFQSTVSNNFVHTLQMLVGMAQGNGLISAYSTNWGLFLPNMTKDATIYTKARIYNECNCATSASCVQSSIPYVPGYVVGCLPLNSFLQSTFECLYNQSCINIISSYVNASIIPRILNNTNSRFNSNLLASDIVEEMFIESWSINISYKAFFQQCQPTSCSYKLIDRYNLLYVVTTILGLYGGLTVLLKIIVPFTIRRLHAVVKQNRIIHIQVVPKEERY
ncbi:unnamed protein product [Adineta steineri]|uniref:Uncharacterized protein n=1 Tax=Adineta steineri TaxID=433720 RepID=A0A818HMP9_9BILA|nr:unnamed protein product [Adineta steineri]CAF3511131.1 unnamed protein product [Adineta steineri]